MKLIKSILCISLCLNLILVFLYAYDGNLNHAEESEKLAVPIDAVFLKDVKFNLVDQGYELSLTLDCIESLKSYLATSIFETDYQLQFELYALSDEVLYTSDIFNWKISDKPYTKNTQINSNQLDKNKKVRLDRYFTTTMNKTGLLGRLAVMTDKGELLINLEAYTLPPNAKP